MMRMALIIGGVVVAAVLSLAFWPAQQPMTAQAPAEPGAPLAEVAVPELAGNALIGQRAYQARCAKCHGVNAAGQEGVAPPLVHKIYEPSHHGDGAFLVAARNGAQSHHWPFGNMPPVEGITDAEVKTIVAYVRALQAANGIN